jgi:hypothetical protein
MFLSDNAYIGGVRGDGIFGKKEHAAQRGRNDAPVLFCL